LSEETFLLAVYLKMKLSRCAQEATVTSYYISNRKKRVGGKRCLSKGILSQSRIRRFDVIRVYSPPTR